MKNLVTKKGWVLLSATNTRGRKKTRNGNVRFERGKSPEKKVLKRTKQAEGVFRYPSKTAIRCHRRERDGGRKTV